MDLEQGQAFAALAAAGPDMAATWAEVYRRPPGEPGDVDEDLYGGFVGNNDRKTLEQLRGNTPEQLAKARPVFADERLDGAKDGDASKQEVKQESIDRVSGMKQEESYADMFADPDFREANGLPPSHAVDVSVLPRLSPAP